jgi:hypothetical protein
MGELLALLVPLAGFALFVWGAFSLAKLAETFQAFHKDYRRVHKLDSIDLATLQR